MAEHDREILDRMVGNTIMGLSDDSLSEVELGDLPKGAIAVVELDGIRRPVKIVGHTEEGQTRIEVID